MAEVIDLNQRHKQGRKRLEDQARKRAAAVAGALSCGMCPRRCAHCGMAIEEAVIPPPEAPYPFCGPCLEEYQAFRRFERQPAEDQDQHQVEAFWHTPRWAEMWRAWLAHMRACDEFRRSAEFLRLMQEHQD